MTIIAVDVRAGLMVADTQVADPDGSASYHTAKIFRAVDGSLVGASGHNTTCLGFLQWARAGGKGKLRLDLDDVGFTGVRLTPGRELQVWADSVIPDTAINVVLAVGVGKVAFEAAHRAGATVREAVRIACDLVPGCGMPLTTLWLEQEAML